MNTQKEIFLHQKVMDAVKKHPAWSTYSQIRNDIMRDVPAITGWYIWLRVSDSTLEEIMYVGKTTQKRMANLQTRCITISKENDIRFGGKVGFQGVLIWPG